MSAHSPRRYFFKAANDNKSKWHNYHNTLRAQQEEKVERALLMIISKVKSMFKKKS